VAGSDDGSGPELASDDQFHDDGAAYVDAATIALRYSSVELGPAPKAPTTRPLSAPVSPRELRDTMGCLVTGVCVVTAVSDGEDVAMTANSVTSLSLDPPLVLMCVARTARFHRAVVEADSWGLSILDAGAAEISSMFARPGRPRAAEFQTLNHHRGEVTGVALVDDSCAFLECATEHVYPGGDHSIVVGRVLATQIRSEPVHPLVYYRGDYSWLRT
jgi:flavin reductase (DIM6/NTAB) family NADH-FMN oxidoreductase RutF